MGIGGLSSRPDTAEKTMLTLAQWKLLYLNWHMQLLLTLEEERQLGKVSVMQTQGSEWTQDPLCYQGPGDVRRLGRKRRSLSSPPSSVLSSKKAGAQCELCLGLSFPNFPGSGCGSY